MTAAIDKSGLWEKVREQFDLAPYPKVPLDESPKEDLATIHRYDLVTFSI